MGIELKIGVDLCVKYVLPLLKKIAASVISKAGKSAYEKLYSKFTNALESFEAALIKCSQTDDVSKLKKHIACCRLGLSFFEKMKSALDGVLAGYRCSLDIAEARFCNLGGNLSEIGEVQ